MNIDPNAPAFPPPIIRGGPENTEVFDAGAYGLPVGLTIRAHFASLETLAEWDNPDGAMSPELMEDILGEKRPENGWAGDKLAMLRFEARARAAVKLIRADALIAALNQPAQP